MTGLRPRHVRYSLVACAIAALLVGAAEWIDSPYQDSRQIVHFLDSHLGSVFVGIVLVVLPVASVSAAIVALTCSMVLATKRWHRGHVVPVSALLVVVGLALYELGGWLAGLYGLDPPQAYFVVGQTMRLTSLATPLVLVVLAVRAAWRSHKARVASNTGGHEP